MNKLLLNLCILAVLLLSPPPAAKACTIFVSSDGKLVLVGNNEDMEPNTFSFLSFSKPSGNSFGIICWGLISTKYIQGGMNDKGLFIDGSRLPEKTTVKRDKSKPDFKDDISVVLKKCATVDEVLKLTAQYNLVSLEQGQIFIADKTGDYAVIGANFVIRKTDKTYFCLTNFSLETATPQYCFRRQTALNYLEGQTPSVENFTSILKKTAQSEHKYNVTLYSQVCDLTHGIVYVYNNRDFNTPKQVNLEEELRKEDRTVGIDEFFGKASLKDIDKNLQKNKNFPDAWKAFENLRFQNPALIDEHRLSDLGYELLNNGNTDAAKEAFKMNLAIQSTASKLSDLGNAYLIGGESEKAEEQYVLALKDDKDDYYANLFGQHQQIVSFRIAAFENAKKVVLAGTFNNYNPDSLPLKWENGAWVGTIKLEKGKYLYKFVVDGQWHLDPFNKVMEKPKGYWDNVLIVR